MPTRFDIHIELFAVPGAAAPDSAALQGSLARGLAEMWPALGLPAEPVVSVDLSTGMFELFDFSLQLDGQIAPVPIFQPGYPAAPLSFRILSAIFANRARLITDEQLRQLRERCLHTLKTATTWSSAPLSVWRAIAALLLQNGFSLDRLGACFEYWSPGKSPETAFERLIEDMEVLTLTLCVHPDLFKAHSDADPGWENRLPEFYTEMYQELGIILPQMTVETDAGLSFETFRLRLNDQYLPVLPGLGPGQVLYDDPLAPAPVFVPGWGLRYALNPPQGNPNQAAAVQGPWAYALHWARYWTTKCAGWYVNTGIADALMDKLEESNRSLIVMIREQWPVHRLCALLRLLLAERVSIWNLSEILDVLLRIDGPLPVDDTQYLPYFPPTSRVVVTPPGAPPAELSDSQLVGQVRANLKFPVVFPHLRGGAMPCYTFEPNLLRDFREGFFQNALPVPGSSFHALLQNIAEKTRADFPKPVFLTPTGIRPAVAAALRPYFPETAVIGHEEMPPFFVPSVIATINFP